MRVWQPNGAGALEDHARRQGGRGEVRRASQRSADHQAEEESEEVMSPSEFEEVMSPSPMEAQGEGVRSLTVGRVQAPGLVCEADSRGYDGGPDCE